MRFILIFMTGFLVARYIYLPDVRLEETGKKVDQIVEKVIHPDQTEVAKAAPGPLEKAGETLDKAKEDLRDDTR